MNELDVNSAIAGEIMTPYVIMLNITARFADLMKKMNENKISAVFIYDKNKDEYFIISQTDIIDFLNDGAMYKDNLAEIPVNIIMKGPVKMVDVETPVDILIRFMTEHNYKRVLISRKGKATGVVSTRDIMMWNNTYFKPAKSQIFIIQDNTTSNFIARHIFEENIQDDVDRNLIDLYGGALNSISIITNEVINGSGKMSHLIKEKRSVLFEPYRNITGILICDYNSIELRRKLRNATKRFYNLNKDIIEQAAKDKRGVYQFLDLKNIISVFEEK